MPLSRQLNHCDHSFTIDKKCTLCGNYQHSIQPLKTKKYATPFHFNLKHYLKNLKHNSAPTTTTIEISQDTFNLLSSICDKFIFTDETLALGLHIFQTLHKLNSNQKFWASTCLMIAGKAGELDKNVPYLNRYQRYADKSFTQLQYEQAQRTIFEAMNFDVQFSTFLTFLNFYLTCGVIFKGEGLSETLVQFFEDDIHYRTRQFLQKGNFSQYQPQLLALSIIKQTRIKYKLPPWNSQLQELTSYSDEEIMLIDTTQQLPLKELSHNTDRKDKGKDRFPLEQLKVGIVPRKKYQFISSSRSTTITQKNDKSERPPGERPLLEKYCSMTKANVSTKENSHGSSKLLLQGLRKSNHNFLMEGFASVSSDLMKRRGI